MLGDPARAEEITLYLKRLSAGDSSAEAPLAEAVYAQIRHIARGAIRQNAAHLTLQPTALANEVLLECARLRSVDWQDREHFYRTAARMLRRRVIDYIRERRAGKRPPDAARTEMEDLPLPSPEHFDEVLYVHEGLDRLAEFDPKLAELIEMVYFGGVSIRDAAQARGVTEKTIDRHLSLARRWLKLRLRGECP